MTPSEIKQNKENKMDTAGLDKITINGIEYERKEKLKPGDRAIIVVDRGWIFAGDVTEKDGRILLTRAVWVFRWERIGFAAVVDDPKAEGVDIRKIDDVDIPKNSEIFRIPVVENWGL